MDSGGGTVTRSLKYPGRKYDRSGKPEREVINLMFSRGISSLAAVRIRHKLSLAEVSKMLGISINSLKRIEKTERLSSNIKRKWQEFMVVHQSC